MRWNDWKLGARLTFAFGLLLLMALSITALGMSCLLYTSDAADE